MVIILYSLENGYIDRADEISREHASPVISSSISLFSKDFRDFLTNKNYIKQRIHIKGAVCDDAGH